MRDTRWMLERERERERETEDEDRAVVEGASKYRSRLPHLVRIRHI